MDDPLYLKLIQNLPGRRGILGRSRYFNSVVLVPFITTEEGISILFQKRAAGIRQGGEISFPGGGFSRKKDKSFKDTAIRETIEELGISREDILIDGRLESIVAPMGAIIEIFIGRLTRSDIDSFNINSAEVEHLFAIPLEWFIRSGHETYRLRLEVHPYLKKPDGDDEIIFPAKELGLPEKYWGPWGDMLHEVYVYRTEHGIIWGITAEIVRDIIQRIGG